MKRRPPISAPTSISVNGVGVTWTSQDHVPCPINYPKQWAQERTELPELEPCIETVTWFHNQRGHMVSRERVKWGTPLLDDWFWLDNVSNPTYVHFDLGHAWLVHALPISRGNINERIVEWGFFVARYLGDEAAGIAYRAKKVGGWAQATNGEWHHPKGTVSYLKRGGYIAKRSQGKGWGMKKSIETANLAYAKQWVEQG